MTSKESIIAAIAMILIPFFVQIEQGMNTICPERQLFHIVGVLCLLPAIHTKGGFKLHRLLQFTRAVGLPPSADCCCI